MNTETVSEQYLFNLMNSPRYFDKIDGKLKTFSPEMKLLYIFNSYQFIIDEPGMGQTMLEMAKRQAKHSLNLDDERYFEGFDPLFKAKLLDVRYTDYSKKHIQFTSYESDSILLSSEIKLDAFLSTLPESYVSHYLYVKHHQGIVDNKLTMTIEEISKATGVNPPEIGFMNKLFKEMGYFSITKEPKTGTNIYEVIK